MKLTNKSISSLNDLLGKEVVFYYFDDDEEMQEIKGIVTYAYIDDFSFYEKWNEPLYIKIGYKPLEDRSIYKNITEEDLMFIFLDEYNLESILQILN